MVFRQRYCGSPSSNNHRFTSFLLMVYFCVDSDNGFKYQDRGHWRLKAERERGPDFLRLANTLSALYPKESEEKRLLDAMLLAMPK